MKDATNECGYARPPRRFPAEEYERRLKRFRAALAKRGVDGALVTRAVSRRYLTGFDSSAGILAVSVDEGAVFSVDFRYIVMARKTLPFARCLLKRPGADDPVLARAAKWGRVGYEEGDSQSLIRRLAAKCPALENGVAIDDDLAALRAVKSPREIAALRAAVAQGDALCADILPRIRPGMTEWALRNLFRAGADKFGHGESFDTIVCAGRNCAECHHEPDLTVIRRGSPVLMDFGVVLDGYHSDMTRCIAVGKPPSLFGEIYAVALEANLKAIDGIRPGMTGAEVDAIARTVIAKAGYGEAFGHSLGHSVGLEIHEAPNFSQGETRVIKPGMVITVEPGIYLPGRAGVRIEDVVLVTRNGCEVLTKTGKEMEVWETQR
ncbi:MAG: aminopeptidase P family protein [Kiritimatiellae bacterium]|nr:aminopeptidase P family protein [Kiritimatiellia bacterium]